MAEIKSTLDLVMEKTKHLSMTGDEKLEEKRKQAAARLKGLVQKFEDGVLNRRTFGRELDQLGEQSGLSLSDMLCEELIDRVALMEDNSRRLVLLQSFCGVSIGEIESALENFEEDYRSSMEDRVKEKKEELFKKHGIGGNGVFPNLDRDEAWTLRSREIRDIHGKILGTVKAAMRHS